MYSKIAKVYDYIFPQNSMQLSFIESVNPIKRQDHVLEVGCATGNLTQLLSTKSDHVTGLDLDTELLKFGKDKYPLLQMIHLNMLEIDSLNKTFDKIVCFGNTLVHLPNRALVKDFFKGVYHNLKDGGYFIVQIINYDRIYNQKLISLATIDNDHIRFKRDYVLNNGYVDFKTELTIKEDGEVMTNSIKLLDLRQEEIKDVLESLGFKDIRFYGNLKCHELTQDSVPLLFSCRK